MAIAVALARAATAAAAAAAPLAAAAAAAAVAAADRARSLHKASHRPALDLPSQTSQCGRWQPHILVIGDE